MNSKQEISTIAVRSLTSSKSSSEGNGKIKPRKTFYHVLVQSMKKELHVVWLNCSWWMGYRCVKRVAFQHSSCRFSLRLGFIFVVENFSFLMRSDLSTSREHVSMFSRFNAVRFFFFFCVLKLQSSKALSLILFAHDLVWKQMNTTVNRTPFTPIAPEIILRCHFFVTLVTTYFRFFSVYMWYK